MFRLFGRNQKNLRKIIKNEFSATTKSYKINTNGVFQYLTKNLEKIVVSEGMYCFGVRLTRAIFVLSKNRLGVISPLSFFRYHDFSLV